MVLVVALGLLSREFGGQFPDALKTYPGDALWAVMIWLLCGLVWPRLSIVRCALLALAICFVVEFAQLVRAAWLVELRQTTLGRLVLGSDFDPLDLVAYTIGVGLGFAFEMLRSPRSTS